MSHVRSLNSALYFSSGKVVMLGTFVVWMFFNSYVKASVLFTTLALFEVLRASVGLLMPWGIRFFAEAIAATKRIEVGSRFGIPISDNFKSIACRFTVILFQSSITHTESQKVHRAFFHRDNKIRDTIHERFKRTLCRKLANINNTNCLTSQAFLLKEERNLLETSSQNSHDHPPLPDDVVISLEAYTSSWAKNASAITLDSISLDVQKVSGIKPTA